MILLKGLFDLDIWKKKLVNDKAPLHIHVYTMYTHYMCSYSLQVGYSQDLTNEREKIVQTGFQRDLIYDLGT